MVRHSEPSVSYRMVHGSWAQRLPEVLWRVFIYALLILGCILVMTPLAWMVSTSLKDMKHIFVFPPEWIPDPPQWGNFLQALTRLPFGLYFRNTLTIASIALVAATISSSIIAYGFARLDFPARDPLFLIMLATLMIPTQVTLVSKFILFNWLGLVDTFVPLVAQAFFGSPIYIFLLRQFFLTIPMEMDEAALIDGCSKWGILWRIILPQSSPVLCIVAIFSFLFHWHAFLGPLIYLNSPEKRTLALGLSEFKTPPEGGMQTPWNLLMAASLVIMLPPILIFFVAQRYFIQGIVFTGVKG